MTEAVGDQGSGVSHGTGEERKAATLPAEAPDTGPPTRPQPGRTPSARPRTPLQLAWRQLRRHRLALLGGVVLAVFYVMALVADFLAPYPLDFSDRERFYHPPAALHFRDAAGGWHLRPFVYATRLVDPGLRTFEVDRPRAYPVHFFVRGEPYRLLWVVPPRGYLFWVDDPACDFLLRISCFWLDVVTRIF